MTQATSRLNHVFVDFENVPSVDLAAIGDHDAEVILLIGEKQRRLELSLVQQIHEHATKVTLVEVGASGRNALDLVLAWHLGKTAERHPDDFYFVVSKDKDYNPLIAHLRTRGLKIERIEAFSALPFLVPRPLERRPPRPRRSPAVEPPRKSAPTPPEPPIVPVSVGSPRGADRLLKLIDRLQNRTKARPARRKTLLSYIQQFYGGQLGEPDLEAVLATLEQRDVIALNPNGRVSYP